MTKPVKTYLYCHCNFCGKNYGDCEFMITGSGTALICGECIVLCGKELRKMKKQKAKTLVEQNSEK